MPKLTVAAIRAAKHPGSKTANGKDRPIRLPDGDGLYLQIAPTGAKTWLFRYTLRGKAREMGLGPAAVTREDEQAGAVPLAAARDQARQQKALLRQGLDPIEARNAARAKQEAGDAAPTFRAVTDLYLAAHAAGWTETTRGYLKQILHDYAYPHMGTLPVSLVGTGQVTAALEPLWREKPETAIRLRGRIEAVLDYAAVRGWRQGENPARWRGHLDKLFPARSKVAKVQHHAALPWREVGAFLAALRARDSTAARALEFQILTAARAGEVFGMRWGEVDFAGGLWTVPAERMKAKKEHRVPLSAAALALLQAMRAGSGGSAGDFVFPGQRRGKGLSDTSVQRLLGRLNRKGTWRDPKTGETITAHGFRSCFRDWVAERTGYPRELAEAALAHVVGGVEGAYQRGDMLEKRRRLMEDWARFCAKPIPAGEVVALRTA